MIGIIVQLIISWLLIWFFEKGNLSVLGFGLTKSRLADFLVFFIITAACCALGFLFRMYLAKEQWELNPSLNIQLFFSGLWWNIKSVLFEELIFRGTIFYILIRKIGALKAIILSSIAFGIYHWFSFEIWGDIQQMAIFFFITGIMGAVYAFGYAKTFSLFIPCAIHLGWNFTQSFVFSQGKIGDGIFRLVKSQPNVTVSYFSFFLIFYVPLLCAWMVNFLLIKRKRQVEISGENKIINDGFNNKSN
jgi:membrane protease YdiL (CAAX protease family)